MEAGCTDVLRFGFGRRHWRFAGRIFVRIWLCCLSLPGTRSRHVRNFSDLIILPSDLGDGGDLVALVKSHDADTLGVAADDANLVDMGAVDHALRGDEHDIVLLAHGNSADHLSVAVAGTNVTQAFATAALLAVAHVAAIFDGFLAFDAFSLHSPWLGGI